MKGSQTKRLGVSFRASRLLAMATAILAALTIAPRVGAQSTGGRLRGTVTDPSGSAVAGARVTLLNEATNISRDAETNDNGEYLFLEVPVGSYSIEVNQQGFKRNIHREVKLNLNEVVSVDIALQVGGATETVEVTGEP